MSKHYGMTTEISVQHMDEMYPIVCQNIEFEIPRRAYQEGFGLTGRVTHAKNVVTRLDEETGETYEVCVVWSAAPVTKLEDRSE